MAPTGLEAALPEWRAALGAEHVVTSEAERAAAQTATFATTQKIPAILRPANTGQVQECLKIAQRHRVPLYPVSRGRNWGYGSRVPPRDGTVLLELARMDRILGHDERLGTLTVEPGVTFAQAHEYLSSRGSRLFLTTTGGPPDASLVGNALERGDGRGPHCDVFLHSCGMEVVLPTGERLETGHAGLKGAKTAHLHRWGLGPSLDGAFTESNLGVVTRMTFWLTPHSAWFREFFCQIHSAAALPGIVDELQKLAMEGTLHSGIFLWNDVKALSVTRQYPFAEAGGRTPLPQGILDQWREKFGLWAVTSALHAPNADVGEALARRVSSVLEPLAGPVIWSQEKVSGESGQHGRPSVANLAMGYWRKRAPMPADPNMDRDRCGFVWSCAAVPFTGEDAVAAVEIAERVPRLFAFEPNLAVLAPTPRCLYLITALVYDRDARGDDDRAKGCIQGLNRELFAAGYPLTRMGLESEGLEFERCDDGRAALARLKDAVDPGRVLAPGRYEI